MESVARWLGLCPQCQAGMEVRLLRQTLVDGRTVLWTVEVHHGTKTSCRQIFQNPASLMLDSRAVFEYALAQAISEVWARELPLAHYP